MQELVDPSKVRCSGPGLGSGVRVHVPQTFTVDSSKAGVAPLEVQLYGPAGLLIQKVTHTGEFGRYPWEVQLGDVVWSQTQFDWFIHAFMHVFIVHQLWLGSSPLVVPQV